MIGRESRISLPSEFASSGKFGVGDRWRRSSLSQSAMKTANSSEERVAELCEIPAVSEQEALMKSYYRPP